MYLFLLQEKRGTYNSKDSFGSVFFQYKCLFYVII